MYNIHRFNTSIVDEYTSFSKDTTYLTELTLGDYLKILYPNHTFIHNAPLKKYKIDYYCAELSMAVEFDGATHYTNPQVIRRDSIKNNLLAQQNIKIIRIPYFIQLTPDVISTLFDIDNPPQLYTYPHGFVSSAQTMIFPSAFCMSGLRRFYDELSNTFALQRSDIIKSLLIQLTWQKQHCASLIFPTHFLYYIGGGNMYDIHNSNWIEYETNGARIVASVFLALHNKAHEIHYALQQHGLRKHFYELLS
jgi:hypothetical protein